MFAGSFDLEAAETVAGADVDVLGSLLDKSLLRQTADGRFFMLETIREYALGRLEAGVEAQRVRRQHAEYFLELAEAEEARLVGTEEAAASRRLRVDLPNLRVALETAIAADDAETALRLAGALHPFWYLGGHFVEGRGWAGARAAPRWDAGATREVPRGRRRVRAAPRGHGRGETAF